MLLGLRILGLWILFLGQCLMVFFCFVFVFVFVLLTSLFHKGVFMLDRIVNLLKADFKFQGPGFLLFFIFFLQKIIAHFFFLF